MASQRLVFPFLVALLGSGCAHQTSSPPTMESAQRGFKDCEVKGRLVFCETKRPAGEILDLGSGGYVGFRIWANQGDSPLNDVSDPDALSIVWSRFLDTLEVATIPVRVEQKGIYTEWLPVYSVARQTSGSPPDKAPVAGGRLLISWFRPGPGHMVNLEFDLRSSKKTEANLMTALSSVASAAIPFLPASGALPIIVNAVASQNREKADQYIQKMTSWSPGGAPQGYARTIQEWAKLEAMKVTAYDGDPKIPEAKAIATVTVKLERLPSVYSFDSSKPDYSRLRASSYGAPIDAIGKSTKEIFEEDEFRKNLLGGKSQESFDQLCSGVINVFTAKQFDPNNDAVAASWLVMMNAKSSHVRAKSEISCPLLGDIQNLGLPALPITVQGDAKPKARLANVQSRNEGLNSIATAIANKQQIADYFADEVIVYQSVKFLKDVDLKSDEVLEKSDLLQALNEKGLSSIGDFVYKGRSSASPKVRMTFAQGKKYAIWTISKGKVIRIEIL